MDVVPVETSLGKSEKSAGSRNQFSMPNNKNLKQEYENLHQVMNNEKTLINKNRSQRVGAENRRN